MEPCKTPPRTHPPPLFLAMVAPFSHTSASGPCLCLTACVLCPHSPLPLVPSAAGNDGPSGHAGPTAPLGAIKWPTHSAGAARAAGKSLLKAASLALHSSGFAVPMAPTLVSWAGTGGCGGRGGWGWGRVPPLLGGEMARLCGGVGGWVGEGRGREFSRRVVWSPPIWGGGGGYPWQVIQDVCCWYEA